MTYLTAAVVLVGLLAAANLLFTFGVVRRLREQTAEMARLRGRGPAPEDGTDIALPVGAAVAPFAATDVDGRAVDLTTLGARPFVAFLSPNCGPCKERLPGFLEFAAARPGGRGEILAVAVGQPDETADLVAQLAEVATVVREPDQGPVQKAFGVTGYPAFILVENGAVAAANFDLTAVADRDAAVLAVVG
ncbi:TlpA family protein disulfide reductase [Plantactinospora sonchi]|uniref:TlpA disulfide reductase family protein n=1 Tax=Plantactinospora sonchi TaxID=1544735 RepID=A0ABU7S0B4_9ACTN